MKHHIDIMRQCITVRPCNDLTVQQMAHPIVIVIAPHPDDDVIGMGGTMRLLSDKGYSVLSVYATDGDVSGAKKSSLPQQRRKEALAALKVVGAYAGIFLEHKSTQLRHKRSCLIREIQDIVLYFRPYALYLPSLTERHPTHVLVTCATLKALRPFSDRYPKVWGYHVWSDCCFAATQAVDITAVCNIKRRAIQQHKTQLAVKPYDSGILGKNHYDGIYRHTHKKQAFSYIELFDDMRALCGLSGSALATAVLRLFKASYPLLFPRQHIRYC
ncbi:MAG: PIG-L family deacetylase [Desulfobacterota bacterium]|nr:PIG-L family deacetylase [Thermodesulfobacteriota bacterium]